MKKLFISLVLVLPFAQAFAEDKQISEIRQDVLKTIPKVEEVCSNPIPLNFGENIVSEYIHLGFLRKTNKTSQSSLENAVFSDGKLIELTDEGKKYAKTDSNGKLIFCAGKVGIKIKSIEKEKENDRLYKVVVEIDKSNLADWIYDKGFQHSSNGPFIKNYTPTEEIHFLFRSRKDGSKIIEHYHLSGHPFIFKYF
ncbi:hypothetical protein [Taylorella equigenitalis]|uniref:Uncharacterized protein n=2 Tax=Taylorella equigenitalis TaxID=29575 RepID=A0A654KFA3_TAYEM|nr:hypothetical protein [Taylorella equigenitalis]ADU91091.1 hypothetical protein TEQUI_0135 [Taylorella equigenitalis MCE9]AFN36195.1 putative exported protein [Taylorella equigenitalis ATCC 35865]ASY39600.1 hypothetical protein CA604_05670 [Taylorella equigenitalis]WDU55926.1 hypothetical protein KPH58_05510 [Taylorella equigenitalis]VEG31948.1 Uncharacterised protein [Taylorella equigenitalis ATCC 35865]